MSSLHEPQVGQALEPEVSATAATADLLNNQRNTRPFSASDECGGDLLTVLVHFGRNLGALVTKQVLTKLDTLNSNTVAGEQLNTYVVASREARQKDEQLQKLKEQAEFAQRREQQQLAELLASTNGNGIAFPARPEHQAASQRFTLLATKYKELDHECQTTRHDKLQEAHLVQSALVQRLQRDKQHATTLKKAVRMQEKVIRQFEQTVAQQSTETPERPSIRQHAPETDTPDIDGGDSETREALLRVRVQVLEQQLQTNAREAAAEMSALRLRILELETAESRRTGK
ncbi:hypothetical protein GQ600_9997 [Phytophthora cactorum]|nr:hypothetical protein GQ600_9997 [Phytophthora cactorum]